MQPANRTAPAAAGAAKEPLLSRNFVLACLITLASFSSFYFLLTTLPFYVIGEAGGSKDQVGLIIGVFSVTTVLLRPFIGRAADDWGRRVFIVAGSAIMALAGGLYTLTRTVPLLLSLRVFHGVGWASFGTATNALVADVVPRSRRGEAMGYYGMFSNLAMAIGPALGIAMMRGAGFTALFVASAALGVVALLLSLGLSDPARGGRAPRPAPVGGGLLERTALFPGLVLALTSVTYGSIVSFLPLFAVETKITDNPGIFFTVYAVVLIVARGFTGQISDRFGRPAVIAPGLLLAALALGLLATTNSLWSLLAVAVLYGLGFAAVQPAIMAMVVDRAAPQRRGAAMGTFSAAMDLGIGLGSVIWGFVAQAAGYHAMYVASGGVALLALVVFLAGLRGGLGARLAS
ncbi:MAG: MFS transporter [Chloroflexi bacterium]|nr:MFS transporter [Chloroflexota bacterium]